MLSGRRGACPATGCCHPHPDRWGLREVCVRRLQSKEASEAPQGIPWRPQLPFAPLCTSLGPFDLFTYSCSCPCRSAPWAAPWGTSCESQEGESGGQREDGEDTTVEMSGGAGLRNWVSPLQACGHLPGEDGALVKP